METVVAIIFTVLLVDDEVFVRKGLLEIIPWDELKLVIVGEADNGKEALHMIGELQPDLVITDIRMPILDGLGLIRSVKENAKADPIFIIISGYHDFKYAQQALRYEVHDYILKPIDEEEMTAALRKLVYKIGEKRNAALAGNEHTSSSILEALVQENLRIEEAEQYCAKLGLKGLSNFRYILADIHVAPQQKPTGIKQIQAALRSLEKRSADIPVFEQQPGKFGMLLGADRVNGKAEGTLQDLNRLRATLSCQLDAELSIYAGGSVDSLANIHRSYLEANEAARHKYAENGGVILYEQIKDKPLYVFDMPPSLSSKLIMQLEEGNKPEYQQTVDSMFQLFHAQRFTPQAVTGSLSRCITGIISVIKEMEGCDEGVRRLKELAEREHGNWSLQMLKEHFMLAMKEAEEYIARLRKEQFKGSINQIKKYIDMHYCENISLKSIAAEFYMNAVYLGRLFRKNYGVYFNDYLLELRVREAKKLLRQTDLRMYEIAARVGFQNADYFVTQFEKLENVSPSEYRNMLIEKR